MPEASRTVAGVVSGVLGAGAAMGNRAPVEW